jgi:hypothetical protein
MLIAWYRLFVITAIFSASVSCWEMCWYFKLCGPGQRGCPWRTNTSDCSLKSRPQVAQRLQQPDLFYAPVSWTVAAAATIYAWYSSSHSEQTVGSTAKPDLFSSWQVWPFTMVQAAAQGLFQYLTQFLQALDILTIKYKAMNAVNNYTRRCEWCSYTRRRGAGLWVWEQQGILCNVGVCNHALICVMPEWQLWSHFPELDAGEVLEWRRWLEIRPWGPLSSFKWYISDPMTDVWFCGFCALSLCSLPT